DEELAGMARSLGAPEPLRGVAAPELERVSAAAHPQAVVAEVEPYPYADAAALMKPEDALVVALDQVQDPQNLGAVARSAECAGATWMGLPARRAAGVTRA